MLSVTKVIDNFQVNDVDEASDTVTYIGMEGVDGNWCVNKIDSASGTSMGYAGVKNNATIGNYDLAWTNHLALEYGNFSTAF